MESSFLLQATKVLTLGDYDSRDMKMIYQFLITLDYDEMIEYNMTSSILSYETDLHLYIELVDVMIKMFEDKEEYEKWYNTEHSSSYLLQEAVYGLCEIKRDQIMSN